MDILVGVVEHHSTYYNNLLPYIMSFCPYNKMMLREDFIFIMYL